MRLLLVMKWQISWQKQDLNIHSQDLNQHAKSQLEWSRRQSRTGWTEITKTLWICNWTETGQGTYTRSLCQKKKGPVKLNGDKLRLVVGLSTGHCYLKKHLFKLGLTDDPTCETRLEDNESATHIPCDCEAIAYWRFCHLGQYFFEPSDYYDTPINKVLHFIRSVGLIKG
jgi:hypothetical protein